MIFDFQKILGLHGSLLMGLSLDGRRLEGVVLHRVKGVVRVERSFEATLSLDPLTDDPKLVGQEIRNRLDEAGLHEKRCLVGVPLSWALTLQTKLPEIPEADVEGFLDIQAERSFPYGSEDLSISSSRCRSAKGEEHALLVAIPKNYLARLDQVLLAARLKPVSFLLLITALQPPRSDTAEGVLALLVRETGIDLQVTCGGGVMTLRNLQDVIKAENGKRQIDADLLAREIRLTLGHLSKEFRETITRIRVFGSGGWAQLLANELAPVATRLGLAVEVRSVVQADGVGVLGAVPEDAPPALVIGARGIAEQPAVFEFLPPKITPWMKVTSRFSSRTVLWSGASAGGILLLVVGAFLIQYLWLSLLESRWRGMESRVNTIEDMQQNIRKFHPWFDKSVHSLAILKKLTEAFPEDGVVTLKKLEVKDLSEISCSGIAQDNQSLLKVLDRLREVSHIGEVKVQQVRGGMPLQFTFDFRWSEGGAGEN